MSGRTFVAILCRVGTGPYDGIVGTGEEGLGIGLSRHFPKCTEGRHKSY